MPRGQIYRLLMMPSSQLGTISVSQLRRQVNQTFHFSQSFYVTETSENPAHKRIQRTDDPEFQISDPECQWVNYFAFLGRLVAAEVTPDWWEIPAITLKEVLAEDDKPNNLTIFKTMALAEFMNHAGDAFFEWCIDSGVLDIKTSMAIISQLIESHVKIDWYDRRHDDEDDLSSVD